MQDVQWRMASLKGRRALEVSWRLNGAKYSAVLVRRGDVAVAQSIKVRRKEGLTDTDRRLPGDSAIIRSIIKYTAGGDSALRWLVGDEPSPASCALIDDVTPPMDSADSPVAGPTPSGTLPPIQVSVRRGPLGHGLVEPEGVAAQRWSSDVIAQMIRGLREEGERTSRIVSYLETMHGVSRATAYRWIAMADGPDGRG